MQAGLTASFMTKADLYAFTSRSKLGVLGSTWENAPQAALVGIAVTTDLEIVFDTLKSSRKYRNLVEHPTCSFVVGWVGEQTLQYEGIARELHSPELERYQQIYFAAWPDGPARMSWPGIAYFIVRPQWIRFSDYDATPPVVEEFSFGGGTAEV